MNHERFAGHWKSRFTSPAGNVHDFDLVVNFAGQAPQACLKMEQTKHGEAAPSLKVNFVTQASFVDRYIGLLSTDSNGLGLNCMTLNLAENGNAMNGIIVWNSITAGCVQQGLIEFKRTSNGNVGT